MTDTPKAPGPPEKPTVELPKVDIAAMLVSLRADMKQVLSSTEEMGQNVTMLIGQGKTFTKWRGEVDIWREEVDEKLRTGSLRAKQPSQHDLETASNLAAEIAARQALAMKVDDVSSKLAMNSADTQAVKKSTDAIKKALVDDVQGFFKAHPQITASIVTLITTAITAATLYLAHGGH